MNNMQNVLAKFKELASSDDDLRLIIFRGKLKPLGKIPASQVGISKNGNKWFRGNIAPENLVILAGDNSFMVTNNMPINAFGEVAEAFENVPEGSRVVILAEYQRKKGNDENNPTWFTQGNVLAVDVLELADGVSNEDDDIWW